MTIYLVSLYPKFSVIYSSGPQGRRNKSCDCDNGRYERKGMQGDGDFHSTVGEAYACMYHVCMEAKRATTPSVPSSVVTITRPNHPRIKTLGQATPQCNNCHYNAGMHRTPRPLEPRTHPEAMSSLIDPSIQQIKSGGAASVQGAR